MALGGAVLAMASISPARAEYPVLKMDAAARADFSSKDMSYDAEEDTKDGTISLDLHPSEDTRFTTSFSNVDDDNADAEASFVVGTSFKF